MKKELTEQALEQIDSTYIQEAALFKRRSPWVGVTAAALAIIVLFSILWKPASTNITMQNPPSNPTVNTVTLPHDTLSASPIALNYAVSVAKYPVLSPYPANFSSTEHTAWYTDQQQLHNQPLGYGNNLVDYFSKIVPALLTDNDGSNVTCSPVNIYMALAMLAEITAGESQQQLLHLLSAESLEALRTQAKHVWRAHYNNDNLSTSILGSSLWLKEGYEYNENTAKLLAENYYASVFRGDLGSAEMDEVLQDWLNQQTMGLLKDSVQNVHLDTQTLIALATTICYQVQWKSQFNKELNTEELFHGEHGDTSETFMHKQLTYGPYFRSEHFSAVYLDLEDGSRMWLILPDEGTSPEELLKNGEIANFFTQKPYASQTSWTNKNSMRVNLSLPKFDICADLEISDSLKKLGITHVFDDRHADFSPILPQEDGGSIGCITHTARVKIDEDGLTAAAYTLILYAGAAEPPTEEVDFTLNRPFLFYVESRDNLPLFAGIVNNP